MKEIAQETFAGGSRGILGSVSETVKSVWRGNTQLQHSTKHVWLEVAALHLMS